MDVNVTDLLKETEAMLEGHFLLSSGRHSDRYFQCARLLQYPDKAEKALSAAADKIRAAIKTGAIKVDALCGPAIGGIIAAYELGRQLGLPAIFTERDGSGAMSLRRGFLIQPGENIIITEDVVTTGKSSGESAAVIESFGGKVAGLACLVDRRDDSAVLPWPIFSAVKLEAANWDAAGCALCKKGIPAEKPGSRKNF